MSSNKAIEVEKFYAVDFSKAPYKIIDGPFNTSTEVTKKYLTDVSILAEVGGWNFGLGLG